MDDNLKYLGDQLAKRVISVILTSNTFKYKCQYANTFIIQR